MYLVKLPFYIVLISGFSLSAYAGDQDQRQQNNLQRTDSQKSYVQPRNRDLKKNNPSNETLKRNETHPKHTTTAPVKTLPKK